MWFLHLLNPCSIFVAVAAVLLFHEKYKLYNSSFYCSNFGNISEYVTVVHSTYTLQSLHFNHGCTLHANLAYMCCDIYRIQLRGNLRFPCHHIYAQCMYTTVYMHAIPYLSLCPRAYIHFHELIRGHSQIASKPHVSHGVYIIHATSFRSVAQVCTVRDAYCMQN